MLSVVIFQRRHDYKNPRRWKEDCSGQGKLLAVSICRQKHYFFNSSLLEFDESSPFCTLCFAESPAALPDFANSSRRLFSCICLYQSIGSQTFTFSLLLISKLPSMYKLRPWRLDLKINSGVIILYLKYYCAPYHSMSRASLLMGELDFIITY